ncbi:MAG: LAGLIDADG family homing endonuclease [Candidatus Thorarchaeota archaeon]
MTIDTDSPYDRFEEFILTYKDEQGNPIYWSRIQQMSLNEETSLSVDFQDLMTFDNVFMTLASEKPDEFLKMADSVLVSILRREDPDYVENLSDEGLLKLRIINYPEHVALRAIRSKHIGRMIRISGILMRASEVKPLLKIGVFECKVCGERLLVEQVEGQYTVPDQCTNEHCRYHLKKPPVRLIVGGEGASRFEDWQRVRIQESPDELPPGSMPRSVDVTLRGDIVDISRPGDLAKVTGILQTSPDFSRRGGRLATFNVYIEASGVEVAEKEFEQLEITEEDEKRIKELSEDQYVHERIYASIAPSIQGHELIKESIALLLFGGVSKTLPDGTRLRGRSNILMIGDPGTGKSIHGNECIFLREITDKGVRWVRNKIAEVVDSLMSRYPGEIILKDETEILPLSEDFNLHTISMNPDSMKTQISRILEVSRHKTSKLVRIHTASGRTVLMTPDHSLTTLNNGHLQVLTAQDLNLDGYLPIARNISFCDESISLEMDIGAIFSKNELVQSDIVQEQISYIEQNQGLVKSAAETANITATTMRRYATNPTAVPVEPWLRRKRDTSWFPRKVPLDERLGRIIGFYLAEGNTEKTMVRFTNLDETIQETLEADLKVIFGKASVFEKGVYICQASICRWFLEMFGTGAAEKNLSDQFLTTPVEFRRSLLSAYFSGDGWIEERSASVNALSKSKDLAYQISDLLSTVGIFASVRRKKLKSGPYKGRVYYRIVIGGEEIFEFHRQIGFVSTSKQDRLENLIDILSKRQRYQSQDIIPNFGNLCNQAAKDLGIKGVRSSSARSFLGEIRGKTYRQRMGRKYLYNLITRMTDFGLKDTHSNAMDKLRALAMSDIFWDKVTKIEHINEDAVVYDLGTDDGHFVVANGNLIVHNSQILKFVSGLAARGLYTSGKGTTAAGLTAAVMHDADTGAMTLEAGALVLADQGIACIDEFDKMDPNDRTAIHEAMEQHTVSIAKAGIVATLNARTSILAAANPTLGRYESSLSVQDNIKLPFTILSRFDLMWILVDTPEATKDRELAKFILGMHQMKKTTTKGVAAPVLPDFLKKYIGYANRYVIPQLSAEASEVIENFYVELRKSAEGGAAPVPITARQLESLVRLSEARAKMALRSKVTKEDAQAAVRLMEESLRMVALDRVTGKIDIDRLVSTMSAAQRSSSDIILKAMKDLEAEGVSTVNQDVLIERVVALGLAAERAEEVIRKLVAEGILFHPRDGKIKRIQS